MTVRLLGWLPVLVIALLGLCNGALAQGESLPEMVKRHDQEIKSLKEAIESLRTPLTKPEADQRGPPTGCTKDLKVVGKYAYSRSQLEDVVTLRDTGISFKFLKAYGAPYSVQLASNVDAINNKRLLQGTTYKLALRNCNYVLSIEDVTPNGATPLTIFLNYE